MTHSSPIIAGIDFSASSAQVLRHASLLVIATNDTNAERLMHDSPVSVLAIRSPESS